MKQKLAFLMMTTVLTGCGISASGGSAKTNTVPNVSNLKTTLPSQVQWNATKQNNGTMSIFTPSGSNPSTATTKVIYQTVQGQADPQTLVAQIVEPLQQNCQKVKVTPVTTTSKHPKKQSVEVICNQIKNAKIGLMRYISVYSDNENSHVLIADTQTPATATPGDFSQLTSHQTQKVVASVRPLQQMIVNTLACDSNRQCQ